VFFTEDAICVQLADGREVRTPLENYPRLKKATPAQRMRFEIIGLGTGIHWPDLDEDLSVEGIVLGRPAVRGYAAFGRASAEERGRRRDGGQA
jgi:hypothetical protein